MAICNEISRLATSISGRHGLRNHDMVACELASCKLKSKSTSLERPQNECNILTLVSTNAENLINVGLAHYKIIGRI